MHSAVDPQKAAEGALQSPQLIELLPCANPCQEASLIYSKHISRLASLGSIFTRKTRFWKLGKCLTSDWSTNDFFGSITMFIEMTTVCFFGQTCS